MTSLKHIAREFGVSVATVSNALSGTGRVSAPLTEKINTRARQLGYRRSAAGLALKTGKSGILGFVMPDITHPLFPKLAQGIEAEADRRGFGVLIADSRGTSTGQEKAIQQLEQRGVDGIILVPQRGTTPKIGKLPAVIINTPSDPSNTVSADHQQGGSIAARLLLDLNHERILLYGGDPQSDVQKDRIKGMENVLNGKVQYTIQWQSENPLNAAFLVSKGITAVLTTSDLIALQVLSEASQFGIRCPEQLSIIGFDDLPLCTAVRPTLTTIAPHVSEISKLAIEQLCACMEGTPNKPSSTAVPMYLIKRGSTAIAMRSESTVETQ